MRYRQTDDTQTDRHVVPTQRRPWWKNKLGCKKLLGLSFLFFFFSFSLSLILSGIFWHKPALLCSACNGGPRQNLTLTQNYRNAKSNNLSRAFFKLSRHVAIVWNPETSPWHPRFTVRVRDFFATSRRLPRDETSVTSPAGGISALRSEAAHPVFPVLLFHMVGDEFDSDDWLHDAAR